MDSVHKRAQHIALKHVGGQGDSGGQEVVYLGSVRQKVQSPQR